MSSRWFEESIQGPFAFRIRIDRVIFEGRTAYQDALIFDNEFFGRVFALDNIVMLTQLDEFFYHESLAHFPLMSHPNPEKVLIIGGGDGGTLREVLKHREVKHVVLCEIDEQVLEMSREYLGFTSCEFDNPRASIIAADGFTYVKEHPSEFDVILVDGTDPIGPGMILFTPDFFELASSALKPDGVFAQQIGSPIYYKTQIPDVQKVLRKVFAYPRIYCAPAPSYPSGYWSFCLCSNETKNAEFKPAMERINGLAGKTRYYSPEIHEAAFTLPPFLLEKLSK